MLYQTELHPETGQDGWSRTTAPCLQNRNATVTLHPDKLIVLEIMSKRERPQWPLPRIEGKIRVELTKYLFSTQQEQN